MGGGEGGDPHEFSFKWPVISYLGLNDNGKSLVDFLRENYPWRGKWKHLLLRKAESR